MLDITDIGRHQNQGWTTSDVSDIEGNFVVKLCGLNIENYSFNTLLPLNEDYRNF